MTKLEHNLKLLSQYNPQAAKAIQSAPDSGIKVQNINGHPELLCVFENGQEIPYYKGQTLVESISEIQKADFKNPRVLIFLGFGLGLHVLEFLRKPHPLNTRILIIEPFLPVIKRAFETTDFTELFAKKVQIISSSNPEILARHLGIYFSDNTILSLANAIEYYVLKGAEQLTPALFKQIPDIVAKAIAHQFNRQFGDPYDAYMGTENFLANLKLNKNLPAIDVAKDFFKDRPGIVIASGPSLTSAIPFLKEVQDKAVMAICPSALPAALSSDIKPHIWLNIERLNNQGNFLTNLPAKPDHVFVGPWLIDPSCFSGNDGTNAFILGNTLQSNWLKSPYPAVDLGHSSAHAAFLILQRLGCNPIYLVGQDLCYYENASHASGTWDESAKVMEHIDSSTEKTVEVLGNSGELVKVNLFWHTYLKTFSEKIIPEFGGTVYHVIPQNMGAKIPGAIRIDPQDLTKQLSTSFEILAPLKEKLINAPVDKWQIDIQVRLKKVKAMLMRLAQDAEQMAITSKKFQFSDQLISGDPIKAKPVYDQYMKTVMAYSTRYRTNEILKDQKEDYELFFHSIVQGLFLRYRIEYFGKPGEDKYDTKEIKRKAEILFHMAKDEAFWANAIYDLIEKYE